MCSLSVCVHICTCIQGYGSGHEQVWLWGGVCVCVCVYLHKCVHECGHVGVCEFGVCVHLYVSVCVCTRVVSSVQCAGRAVEVEFCCDIIPWASSEVGLGGGMRRNMTPSQTPPPSPRPVPPKAAHSFTKRGLSHEQRASHSWNVAPRSSWPHSTTSVRLSKGDR